MSKLILENPWVWVVVLDPGGNEEFLGQHYKEEDISFIPTFLKKEEALECLDHLTRDKEKKYEMVVPATVLEKKGLPIKNGIEKLTNNIDKISLISSQSRTVIRKYQKVETTRKEEGNIKGDISKKGK